MPLVIQPDARHSPIHRFPCVHEKEAGRNVHAPGAESSQQKVIMPPSQQFAEFFAATPRQARKIKVLLLRKLAQNGVKHGLANAVWQLFLLESERAKELPAHAAQHPQVRAFQLAAVQRFRFRRGEEWVWLIVRGRVVEQDVRKLGVRMLGTLQEARATVTPLPDPNLPAKA